MAGVKEMMSGGRSVMVMNKSSSLTPSSRFLYQNVEQQFCFSSSKRLNSNKKKGLRISCESISGSSSTNGCSPLAVISENLFRMSSKEKAVQFKVRGVIIIKKKNKEDFRETVLNHVDDFTDKIGRNVVLELISTQIDPKTKEAKKSKAAVIRNWSKKSKIKAERVTYTVDFMVDSNFGTPGAITVINKHQKEFFLETITIEGFASGAVHFPCNSWVQSTKDHPDKRIFFSNMPYLPYETPEGMKELREKELEALRGDGTGVRKLSDRIYDFATYNDLGNPDMGIDLARPEFGGESIPYPRRCRTGRLPTDTDINMESRVEKPLPIYVPRDEAFEETKKHTFSAGRLRAVLHNLYPSLVANILAHHDFKGFADVDDLYKEGLLLKFDEFKKLPKIVHKIQESSEGILKYDTPMIIAKDKFAWLRDDEFARQALAGINPVNIERLEVFPPVSKLDPNIYGPQESALKEEHILSYLEGMSVQQALEENKLFMIDFHDIYLPFVERINALDGRKTYATRTLFFLSSTGTLKPIAIELSLASEASSKKVLTPPNCATSSWIWQLAKAHVGSNDAGVHQLVNHWLRTHAALEPFILAAHRQMSAMHPIFKLLDPHMRYTLGINCIARQTLISGGGVIESCFTPGPYCMGISAEAYKTWRFDLEGLPADLLRRGMAIKDPSQPHGLKLTIEDYPYATDGLLIWSAIEEWVKTYVTHYYPDPDLIRNDRELQAWYRESIEVGHADLRHADWWPKLSNGDDLVYILTTFIWLASAQHAALNFGQYPYGGYVPNRPTLMRKLIPDENDPEYLTFHDDPQRYFFTSLPSLLQATKLMAVVDSLSTHSPDEEYLGERSQPSTWSGDAEIVEAFYGFSAEIQQIEREIEKRNSNPNLKNRCGAGVQPYELLTPSSEPGVTCRGVPNSVSI